jgi:four helix bundle protein
MQDFRNMDVWKKAHALVLKVYNQTLNLPKDEVFGITIQLRRSAVGIATRLAEASGRSLAPDFGADLRRAAAACNETEYLILLARDLSYWKPEAADVLIADAVEVRKMIFGLLKKV